MATSEYKFREIMKRLEAIVQKEMPSDLMDEYFRILRRFEPQIVNKAVSATIKNTKIKSFPMPGEILVQARAFAGEYRETHKRTEQCKTCSGIGIVLTKRTVDGITSEVAQRCKCEAAEAMNIRYFPTAIDYLPEPPPATEETTISMEELKTMEGQDLKYQGTVRKKCKKCGYFYYDFYYKETPVDLIIEANAGPYSFCEECYNTEGRNRGFWR